MVLVNLIIAGIIGALAMAISMALLSRIGEEKADMLRAVGSLITKRTGNALPVGLTIHLISGSMFAAVYAVASTGLAVESIAGASACGGVVGFFHGFVVSFILVAFVSETHPLEEFRQVSIWVAFAHIIGHIVYGIVTTIFLVQLGVKLGIKLVPGG
jgi:hypothetical protein